MIADLPLPFAPLMKVMWRLHKAQACRKGHRSAALWLSAMPSIPAFT